MLTLAEAIAIARERWPGIAVDEVGLAALIKERGEGVPPCMVDLVLARACVAGDAAAVRYFERDMFDRVDRVLARLGLSVADSDDIKQELRAKLLLGDRARLGQFQGTGPLAFWVASVAGREALGMLRRQRPIDPITDDDLLDAADDPQLVALKRQHSSDFKRAFQATVEGLPARDRAVLRAMIVDDRTVNEVAAVYGIHRATASRWISEIRHALLDGTRKRLRAALELDDTHLDSAMRLIDSNLEVSLYRLLADAA